MTDLFLLSELQMALIKPQFPLANGSPRVVSAIVCVIKHGLQ